MAAHSSSVPTDFKGGWTVVLPTLRKTLLELLVNHGLSPNDAELTYMLVGQVLMLTCTALVCALFIYFFGDSAYISSIVLSIAYHHPTFKALLYDIFYVVTADIPLVRVVMGIETLIEYVLLFAIYLGWAICLETVGFGVRSVWIMLWMLSTKIWQVLFWAVKYDVNLRFSLLVVILPLIWGFGLRYYSASHIIRGLVFFIISLAGLVWSAIQHFSLGAFAVWKAFGPSKKKFRPAFAKAVASISPLCMGTLSAAQYCWRSGCNCLIWIENHGREAIQFLVLLMTTVVVYRENICNIRVFFSGIMCWVKSQTTGPIPFTYKPLIGKRDIRLLRLEPQMSRTRITGKLIHISLDDRPKYQCLSYVWGGSTKTYTIFLDGHEFQVTTNVWNILQQRKSALSTRFLWIDAICINQEDIEEKTRQVILMQKIYAKAERVIVWLGNAPDAYLAWILIGQLCATIRIFEDKACQESIYNLYMRSLGANGNAAPPEWLALRRFFSNPWFERCWVMQEFVLASNILIIYGGYYIDFPAFVCVLTAFLRVSSAVMLRLLTLENKDQQAITPIGILNAPSMIIFRTQYMAKEKPIDFYKILNSGVTFRATEPKDKIFALQGMTNAADNSEELPINYRLSTEDVLLNTAHYFMKRPEAFKVLKLAGCGLEIDPAEYLKDIPSWVTDWTKTRHYQALAFSSITDNTVYRAASEEKANIIVHNRWVIALAGVYIDRVKTRGPIIGIPKRDGLNSLAELDKTWIKWIREAESLAKEHVPNPYFNGQPREEAFWRNSIADRGGDNRPAHLQYGTGYRDFKESCLNGYGKTKEDEAKTRNLKIKKGFFLSNEERHFLMEAKQDPRPVLERIDSGTKFANALGNCCNGRRFAVTEKGYMAIVPPGTEDEDVVCLALGAELPFIFRDRPSSNDTDLRKDSGYLLVGECYVHGLADGEGLQLGHKVEMFEMH